jgi:hypothetical protein
MVALSNLAIGYMQNLGTVCGMPEKCGKPGKIKIEFQGIVHESHIGKSSNSKETSGKITKAHTPTQLNSRKETHAFVCSFCTRRDKKVSKLLPDSEITANIATLLHSTRQRHGISGRKG